MRNSIVVCAVCRVCGVCVVRVVCGVCVRVIMVVVAQRGWQKKPLKGASRFWKPWPESVETTVMPSCSGGKKTQVSPCLARACVRVRSKMRGLCARTCSALEMVRLLLGASSEPKSWNWDRVTSSESHTFHSSCSDLSRPRWIAALLKLAVVSLGEPCKERRAKNEYFKKNEIKTKNEERRAKKKSEAKSCWVPEC